MRRMGTISRAITPAAIIREKVVVVKSFGIWSAEFTQAYTPRMTGMDRWIAWDKCDFVGRGAALADHSA